MQGVRQPVADQLAYRQAVEDRRAEVTAQGVGQPRHVLHGQRLVQTQVGGEPGSGRGVAVGAGKRVDRAAGQQVHQPEGQQGEGEEDDHPPQRPPDDKPDKRWGDRQAKRTLAWLRP
ncbi:hypothetical protein Jiend_06530 [Micromonospora endophytica]|nr:hypothetical protein Jiend_06530 [Micromonospora endophytica]